MLNSVIDNNVGNDSYDDAYENDIGPVDIPLLPDWLSLRRSSSWCRSGHFARQVMFTDCCQKFGCQLNMHYPTTVFVTPFTTEYICLLQESNIAINRCDGLFEVGLDFFGSYFIIALDNGNDFLLSIS